MHFDLRHILAVAILKLGQINLCGVLGPLPEQLVMIYTGALDKVHAVVFDGIDHRAVLVEALFIGLFHADDIVHPQPVRLPDGIELPPFAVGLTSPDNIL